MTTILISNDVQSIQFELSTGCDNLEWVTLHDMTFVFNRDFKKWCEGKRFSQNEQHQRYYESLRTALPYFLKITGVSNDDLAALQNLAQENLKSFNLTKENEYEKLQKKIINEKLKKCTFKKVYG